MKSNRKIVTPAPHTHEGAVAIRNTPEQLLQRLTACCFLGEDQFYVDGKTIKTAIYDAVAKVSGQFASDWAIEVRSKWHMRHAPLMIVVAMCKFHPEFVAKTAEAVIQRPDELGELVSLYWSVNGDRKMLSKQLKRGLAAGLGKFDLERLSKWDFNNAAVKLRDVLFLARPKAVDKEQDRLFKTLSGNFCKHCWCKCDDHASPAAIKKAEQARKKAKKPVKRRKPGEPCTNYEEAVLPIPDTWETALSAGADKKKTFTRLIKEELLGGMALLRNLRNMEQAGVDRALIKEALLAMKTSKILPFRFIAAAKHAPAFEPELEAVMEKSILSQVKLAGRTALLVDTSGSMKDPLSDKSELMRYEAAFGLAMVLRWVCDDVDIYSFGNRGELLLLPPRKGFALRDALAGAVFGGGTDIAYAVSAAEKKDYDRLIVFTDEQSRTSVPNARTPLAYMVNVASAEHGVGPRGTWNHISGFSEGILSYIREVENLR